MLYRKFGLFILSLWLLFLFIIIITVDIPISFENDSKFIGISPLVMNNIVPIIAICFLGIGSITYSKFRYDLKGSTEIPFTILKLKNANYDHLSFLATYIIPLICFNFTNTRYVIVLGLLLIAMGVIYSKTNLLYANPSLALIGYNIFMADGKFKSGLREDLILISRQNDLSINQKVSYIKLFNNIYYVKPVNHN